FQHVAFAVFPMRLRDCVRAVSAWPQTEAVVVFGSNDHAFHSCLFERRRPLAAIECGRTENVRVFFAFAPLFVSKRVWAEMNERVILHAMPSQLALRGH